MHKTLQITHQCTLLPFYMYDISHIYGQRQFRSKLEFIFSI